MSRSDQDQRDAERAARRAQRLAERAEQRAQRKTEQARRAMDRAEKLADRAHHRRRDLDDGRSFEDYVDDFTAKWERKAEAWFEKSTRFDGSDDMMDDAEDDFRSSAEASRRARVEAARARRAATEAAAKARAKGRRSESREARAMRRNARRQRRKERGGLRHLFQSGRGLYRDKDRGKICGVCAGAADYMDVETWHVRLFAVLGLVFVPSVAIPAYFIAYFMMDDKPYYRRVTDRYEEAEFEDLEDEQPVNTRNEKGKRTRVPEMSNTDAFRTAKEKFSDLEGRLRSMESHVTSSRFELQRELKKISGDE